MGRRSLASRRVLVLTITALLVAVGHVAVHAQSRGDFVPVTDAMLREPAAADWLMWRRTFDSWGYSPLEQINRENVGELRMVWSRALSSGEQEAAALAYDGVLYMPNPRDVVQAIDAVTGDLIWEYRRQRLDDLEERISVIFSDTNRNVAIYGNLIIDTSTDDYVFALDAETGRLVWETQILDYTKNPAHQTSGPIIANGKVISGRGCMPEGGPDACVITAHDARTGQELWRTRMIPAPGEPGDETWGDVPYEERRHVGAWMVPSFDPTLNLIYVGTSVTSPAPKFMLGGVENKHLYHNSTLALAVDTGEIVWYYQHLNDHWDLDHPFERILVDTVVAPDPTAVSWINPRLQPGEERRVVTGIPGKTGIVYTLDRETGEFLWATPTVTQNVITDIDGATGTVTENSEVVFTGVGQDVLACPHVLGGKDWEVGAYSPLTNTMYFPLRNVCARDHGAGRRRRNVAVPTSVPRPACPGHRPGRHGPGDLSGDRADELDVRATGRHHVTRCHRGGARVRRRRERAVPRPRPGDGRGTLGDQSRLFGHGCPGHVCRRRSPTCRRQHRLCWNHNRPATTDARASSEHRQQPVCLRPARVNGCLPRCDTQSRSAKVEREYPEMMATYCVPSAS